MILSLRSLALPRRVVATRTVPACGHQLAYADGGRVVVCTAEGAIALLDPATGQELAAIPTSPGWPRSFAISAAGDRALAGFDDGVVLELDLPGRRLARSLRLPAPVLGLAFAADGGARVLAGSVDGGAVLGAWSDGAFRIPLERDAQPVRLGPQVGASAVLALPDGGALVGFLDARLRRFAPDGSELASAEAGAVPSAIAAAGEHFLVGGADGSIRVFDRALMLLRTDPAHAGAVLALAPGPGGKGLVSSGVDGVVRLHDQLAGPGPTFHGRHEAGAGALAASPDGRFVVSAGADETLRIWDSATREERGRIAFPDETPLAPLFDSRGRLLVVTDAGRQHTFVLDGLDLSAASLVSAGEEAFGLRVSGARLEAVIWAPRRTERKP